MSSPLPSQRGKTTSPGVSLISVSLPHSPTQTQHALELLNKENAYEDLMSTNFSPSMFSPPDNRRPKRNTSTPALHHRTAVSESPNFFGSLENSHENSRESRPMSRFDHDNYQDDQEDEEFLSPDSQQHPSLTKMVVTESHSRGHGRPRSHSRSKQDRDYEYLPPEGDRDHTQEGEGDSDYDPYPSSTSKTRHSSRNKRRVSLSPRQRLSLGYHEGVMTHTLSLPTHSLHDNSNLDNNASYGNGCNCKKSKCLKLYCECFAALRYCNNYHPSNPQKGASTAAVCRCEDCHNINDPRYEALRLQTIKTVKERNAKAFVTKIELTGNSKNEQQKVHLQGKLFFNL